jgi:CMP-N,N'-diacetyllegionaminic acid synthase
MKILAHIPAREGSKRLKVKNLLPMDGKPLIAHVIEAAKASRYITGLYVNTESETIAKVAREYGAEIYKREERLAQDDITQDTFNYDFIKNMNPDILVLLNPVCPLIETKDIDEAIEKFLSQKPDCLATTTDIQIYAIHENKPVNFDTNTVLPRTQDLEPVRFLNFAIGIWDAKEFRRKFEKDGHACIYGKTLYHTLPKDKALKISDEADFKLVELIMKGKKQIKSS